MASYENLITEQTWQFRPAFSDAWFPDEFAKESENLTTTTAALQSSFSGDSSNGADVFSAGIVESLLAKPVQTPTVSGGSENEVAVSKRRSRGSGGVPPTGRVSKRKPRGSKRSAATTFIAADPADFRRMVQQVTGARFGSLDEQLQAGAAPVLEPARIGGINWDGELLLPTLDTSSFLLGGSDSSQMYPPPPPQAAAGRGAAAAERLFDSFCSFPTLESWKAM